MTDVIQSWLQLIGLTLDLVGFCFIIFEVWLSYEKTYTQQEREKMEADQFDSPESRTILESPMIFSEVATHWRRKAFINGASFILLGFFLQIVAALMGGTFVLSSS